MYLERKNYLDTHIHLKEKVKQLTEMFILGQVLQYTTEGNFSVALDLIT